MTPVFECRSCGACCRGRGGIRLDAAGLARAAAFLRLDESDFFVRYLAPGRSPWGILTADDGFCVFHENGRCRIHPVKPEVCRAWPFLRGPLTFEAAFLDARSACPGLAPGLSWREFCNAFAAEGRPLPPRRFL